MLKQSRCMKGGHTPPPLEKSLQQYYFFLKTEKNDHESFSIRQRALKGIL